MIARGRSPRSRAALLLLGLALSVAAAGCNPYLYQQSTPPPGRAGRLDEVRGFWGRLQHYRLSLSEGVALALTCAEGGPCEGLSVRSDDPSIAEVRIASLAQLEQAALDLRHRQPAAAFVVVGKAPGTTRVRVSAREGSRDVVVTVVARPASAPAQ